MPAPDCDRVASDPVDSYWSAYRALRLPPWYTVAVLLSPKLWSITPSLVMPYWVNEALLPAWVSCQTSVELPVPL
ncbi:hypothetical protein D3C77_512450 [compost metagenome]